MCVCWWHMYLKGVCCWCKQRLVCGMFHAMSSQWWVLGGTHGVWLCIPVDEGKVCIEFTFCLVSLMCTYPHTTTCIHTHTSTHHTNIRIWLTTWSCEERFKARRFGDTRCTSSPVLNPDSTSSPVLNPDSTSSPD